MRFKTFVNKCLRGTTSEFQIYCLIEMVIYSSVYKSHEDKQGFTNFGGCKVINQGEMQNVPDRKSNELYSSDAHYHER